MKKITIAVLVVCILLSTMLPCMATSASSTPDKAQMLYKTSIFKDLSIDFKDAKGQLLRKEAASIITRLMSKETAAIQNKAEYPVDKVKDVKAADAYAPYIGFAIKQKLMNIDENGNFYPDKIVSEKEFISMLVKTLKYEENRDFIYIDTFKYAYKIGILKDERYQRTSFNNYFYSRKAAVDAIYNTLTVKPKGSDNMLISELVQNKVITRDSAVEAGLMNDAQATQIVEVNAISGSQVTVMFNEPISKVTDKDVSIHGLTDQTEIFTSVASISGKTLVLNTSGQTADKKYSITIKNIEDKDGFVTKDLSFEFTGYKNYEIMSDLFKISKIEVESKSIINVFFTQPVNSNAEVPMSYELFEGNTSYVKGSFETMTPKVKKKYENCVSLYLRDKDLKQGVSYTLKIAGDVQSAYGIKLNDGSGDTATLIGRVGDNQGFYVSNVSTVDNKTVEVEFSRDVDINSAASTSNYSINGNSIYINKAVVSAKGEGRTVVLSLAVPLYKDNISKLEIDGVYDTYKQTAIKTFKCDFPVTSGEKGKIGILNVLPIDKQSIAVYFDRVVDSSSASLPTSYSVSGPSFPGISAVSFDSKKPYMAKLYLSNSMVAGGNYTLTVYSSLFDETGSMFSSDNTYSFYGSGTENMSPSLYDAKIIGSDTIMVKVSEDIGSNGGNTIADNYSVEYTQSSGSKVQHATSVSLYDPNTLLVRFSSLDNSISYRLRCNLLTDYTGNTNSGCTVSVSAAR